MSRDDELIREALQLDVCPSEELNKKVLQSAEQRRSNRSVLRTLATVAACIIVLIGTATAVNAALGGRISDFFKEKFSKLTYVFDNGSKVEKEWVEGPNGQWSEKITFVDDNVTLYIEPDAGVTSYDLILKIVDRRYNNFVHLSTFLKEGDPDEALYYEIRGGFRHQLLKYRKDEEKAQVLTGLREAARHADRDSVKNGLLDLASDMEENRRIFYRRIYRLETESDEWDIFFADVSELPMGEAAIILESANGTASWIFLGTITEDTMEWKHSWFYSEDICRTLRNFGTTVYDMRKTK